VDAPVPRAGLTAKRLGKMAILRAIQSQVGRGELLSRRRRCVSASRGVASRPQEKLSGHVDGV